MKLTEKSEITFDLKFILLIAGGLLSLSATFFTLKAEIEEAKKLPKMPMSSQEIILKDELIRKTVKESNQETKSGFRKATRKPKRAIRQNRRKN